jgi:hypothetical protein
MPQPTDAPGVLRDLIDQWLDDGPPEKVEPENIHGAWTASADEFLERRGHPAKRARPPARCTPIRWTGPLATAMTRRASPYWRRSAPATRSSAASSIA